MLCSVPVIYSVSIHMYAGEVPGEASIDTDGSIFGKSYLTSGRRKVAMSLFDRAGNGESF